MHPPSRPSTSEDDTSLPLQPFDSLVDVRKRRKTWTHALEEQLFTSDEIENAAAPERRKTYLASLEAHIDALHDQLHVLGLSPVKPEELEKHKGLNSKTAKSKIAVLTYKANITRKNIEHFQTGVGF